MVHGARWNSPGRRVIYAAETYAGALLEMLVHASGSMPRNQGFIQITIPESVPIEVAEPSAVPGWEAASPAAARGFGDRWYDERRSAVLIVPSVVTRMERNVVINQDHPDFALIHASEPAPVLWDTRLWTK